MAVSASVVGAVRWRGSHSRGAATSSSPAARSRAGPRPWETFTTRRNGDDQAMMEDDQTREDPVGDDREAFKREQEPSSA